MTANGTITAVRAGFLAFMAAMAVYCARNVDFGTDITNFMPDARSADLAMLARHLVHSDMARTMFLTIGTDSQPRDEEKIARAVVALAERLKVNPEVAWLSTAPQEREIEQVWKVYAPRRFGLVSLVPEREIPELTSSGAIAKKAEEARQSLASPAGALLKRMLPADPLGFFGRILDRMREESPSLEVRHGVFFSRDGYGVILLSTKASAFDSAHQGPLLAEVRAAFDAVNAGSGGHLVLELGGVNRFAVDAERSMTGDMWWIGTVSLLGISAVFLAYFRSMHRFLVAMIPTTAGVLVPMALGIALFGHLDGLTVAFGASLVGAAIDYPIYLLNHLAMHGGTRRAAIARLTPSILMGGLSTMASFAGLGLTSFPGFREIAFFSVVGIGAAMTTTITVMPFFVAEHLERTRVAGATARLLGAVVDPLRRDRRVLTAIPIAIALLGVLVLPHMRWQDDLSKLGNVDPRLESEEQRVRGRVSPFETGRAVLVIAPDEQQALERTEEVSRRLAVLRDQGAIEGFRSAADFVYSASLQRRNVAALHAVPDLATRVIDGFAAAGFRPESFAPFRADLAADAAPPLVPADLQGTGLDLLLQPMVLHMSDRTATISYIRTPRGEEAVRTAIASIPGARYFVQRDFVNELYAQFRITTVQQILVGSLLVLGALAIRYRRWRPSVAAFLPSALVPVVVLSVLTLCGVAINLLHVVSLVMVMGMGVDYGIFVVDSHDDPDHFHSTLVSLLLCCLTTVFAFATLAISSHPALRAMGVTTGTGVLLSLLLAPVSLLLVETRGPKVASIEEA